MYYCLAKGKYCDNANVNGYCGKTVCCETATITMSVNNSKLGRVCQICGEATDGLDDYICNNCREKLKKLLGV